MHHGQAMRLSIRALHAWRGGREVLSGVTASVGHGEALLVMGPNGSGKSTLLRVVAGLLPATQGSVVIEDDGDAASPFDSVAAHCHYLGHLNAMKTSLSLAENLATWRDFCGPDGLDTSEALEAVDLDGLGHLPFAMLSAGQRRRAAIARLLVSRRPIWLLDEPTVGLDAASEARFGGLMAQHLGSGGIVIAATHLPLGLAGAQVLEMGGTPSPLWGGSGREADRGGGRKGDF